MDGRVVEPSADYESDEYAWMLDQAAALRARRLTSLDTENLAEFLEAMARSEVREVASRLALLLHHLLKFRLQPERATPSWRLTVLNAQAELADLLESKTLRRQADEVMPKAWQRARNAAAADMEMPLRAIPRDNPWTLDAALAWTHPSDLPSPAT